MPSRRLQLVVTNGDASARTFSLDLSPARPHIIIGQDDALEVCLKEDGIAPRHCSVSLTPAGIEFASLVASPLPSCNGNPVSTKTLLQDGDSIQIGPVVLSVQMNPSNGDNEAKMIDPAQLQPLTDEPTGQTAGSRRMPPGSRGSGFGSRGQRAGDSGGPSSGDSLVDRLIVELQREYPDRAGRRTRRELQALIERGRERARSYGLESDDCIAKFLHCVMLLDNELARATSADVGYVLDTLTVPNKSPEERIDRALNIARKAAQNRTPPPAPLLATPAPQTPPSQTPRSQTPPNQTPPTQTPQRSIPANQTPPRQTLPKHSRPAPELSPMRPSEVATRVTASIPEPQTPVRTPTPPPKRHTANTMDEQALATQATPPPEFEELQARPVSGGLPDIEGFRIVDQIASGGMGTVYRAHDLQLDIEVAIKVLRSLHPAAQQQFLLEARAAAKLQHPNIVPVLRYARYGQGGYFVMQLIRGMDAHRLTRAMGEIFAHTADADHIFAAAGLEPANLNPELRNIAKSANPYYRIVAHWIAGVADGLERAHTDRIIHYDVKPSNLMLAADGRLMLGDFGLATLGDRTTVANPACVGTPAYLSPEMLAGWASRAGAADTDRRVDIWGLGLALYELLTYGPAFEGPLTKVLRLIATVSPTPPREVVWHVPEDLQRICLKAIERNPDNRYARAVDMADDLRAWIAEPGDNTASGKSWGLFGGGKKPKK